MSQSASVITTYSKILQYEGIDVRMGISAPHFRWPGHCMLWSYRIAGKSGTKILFVIPQANERNIEDGPEIINASNVFVPVGDEVIHQQQPTQIYPEKEAITVNSRVETIRVPLAISPYTSPHVLSDDATISKWNYQLTDTSVVKIQDPVTGVVRAKAAVRYQFSGSYGPNLMDEVERYGLVGAEIARQRNFDVIHAHDWLTFKAGIAAKLVSGKPLVVHVHATEFDRAGKNVDMQIFNMEREGMEAADQVIAVSQLTKNIIVSRYTIPSNKINVVHNGALPQKQIENNQLPPIGKRGVTFLGRITYQKARILISLKGIFLLRQLIVDVVH